ncbi:TPA: hypothetical protein ACGP1K_004574, partial [Escherichia coli]
HRCIDNASVSQNRDQSPLVFCKSDTTVSQLLVELELKDLKTGIHSAPGYSLFGHCRLHWFKHGNGDCGEKS